MKNVKTRSAALVLLAAGFWGTMGIFVRYFNQLGVRSMDVVLLRVAVAAVLLPAVVAVAQPGAFRIRLRDLWIFAGTGLLSIVMFSYCYFRTIEETSLSVAAVLLYSAPVMVVLMSALFFKERITGVKVLACLLAFAGCILVSDLRGASVPPEALLTGILSAFGYALYSIFSRIALNRGYSSFTVLVYTFWIALIGVLPFSRPAAVVAQVAAAGWQGWAMVLVMGLITAVLPYTCYTLGLSGMEAGKASIMASLEPVVATVLGGIVFQEIPTVYGFLGIACVLAGVVLLNVRFKKM